jgi:ribosomal protein S18 acetylase RimI-like enzyme
LPVLLRMMRSLAEHPPAIDFNEGEVRAALRKFLARPEFGSSWLICLGGQVAGYVILTLGYSFEYRGRDAFVDELYIEPGFRRMGLGRRALKFAEERAQRLGVNALHLEVDAANYAALELYRGSGYASHGRYLMTKWLR